MADDPKALSMGRPPLDRSYGSRAAEFDWSDLVALTIHPLKVAIIEALLSVTEPMSPTELEKMVTDEASLSLVQHHAKKLMDLGVLEVVHTRPVRGAQERYYFISARKR